MNSSTPPGAIDEYTLDGQRVRRVVDGIFNPSTLAVDSTGTLYVGNSYGGYPADITEYSAGSGKVRRTITYGISPGVLSIGLNMDAQDRLYALSLTPGGSGIPHRDVASRYQPGKVKPSEVIRDGFCGTTDSAVAPDGTYYIANTCGFDAQGAVVEYAPKTGRISRIIVDKILYPQYVTVDDQGTLYVVNLGGPRMYLSEYAKNSSKASVTVPLVGPNETCLIETAKPAVGAKGAFYMAYEVASSKSCAQPLRSQIILITPGSAKFARILTAPQFSQFGTIALDARDNLYAVLETPGPRQPEQIIIRYTAHGGKPRLIAKGISFGRILVR